MPTFQKLVPHTPIRPSAEQIASLRQWARKNGQDPNDVDKGIERDFSGEFWGNDTYLVIKHSYQESTPPMAHLSIRRKDRKPIRSWRDFQAIKTQLIGDECEGVELYPAESRVVDTANQYHLWCISQPGAVFPFGFTTGLRTDETAVGAGAVQEPGAGS